MKIGKWYVIITSNAALAEKIQDLISGKFYTARKPGKRKVKKEEVLPATSMWNDKDVNEELKEAYEGGSDVTG